MLTRLKHNGVGCKIGLYFIGALGYADDVVFAMSTYERSARNVIYVRYLVMNIR